MLGKGASRRSLGRIEALSVFAPNLFEYRGYPKGVMKVSLFPFYLVNQDAFDTLQLVEGHT